MASLKRRSESADEIQSKRTKSKHSVRKNGVKSPTDLKLGRQSKDEDELAENSSNGSNEMDVDAGDEKDSNSATLINDGTKPSTSRESHAKQKALVQERKAAKPNADAIARTKKLWERLRRKSHVPLEERKKLVAELYSIITGRVKEFVFKHDSVRVIQTALKYANPTQRKEIATELQGDFKTLAESKYAKFLLGKILVHGDSEIRDMVIPEFYGHVKRLVRHPEASWILDDIYRTVATPAQKARLLREWYGMEFVFLNNKAEDTEVTASLVELLEKNPEKRDPILKHLHALINQLVQKKTTGFTILHDAMLQYFLSTKPGSTEATEFIELLKDDEEGDMVKNLAFTQSGARLMCLALAYSSAKDRKLLLRMYKDTIKLMSGDVYGHTILLTAYEVVDDTKLTQKLILSELLTQDDLLPRAIDQLARVPILHPFVGEKHAWLLSEADQQALTKIKEIRSQTSKKDPETRRNELVNAASPALLEFISANAPSLAETSFGCRFILEILFSATGDKAAALKAVAAIAGSETDSLKTPAVGRMLKSLVQGGRFDADKKEVIKVQPPLKFDSLLYDHIKKDVIAWATEWNPFVVVALLESDDFDKKDELAAALKKHRKQLKELVAKPTKADSDTKRTPAAAAATIILERIS
ncbi:pumilio domain member 6 [Myotisia sp. PD_48]|nr:pumilio domain member 6 [Myotisia sp. PD_48]